MKLVRLNWKTMMNKLLRFLVPLALLFFLTACGSKKSPTGGPEDLERPIILNSLPAEFGQIDQNRIEINFSKPLDKNSVAQAIYIYPPVRNKKITVDKSSLHIRFNEELLPNTNYYVTVSSRLKDIRGNNLEENQTLIFAHGELQNLRISGKVSFEEKDDAALPVQLRLLSADSLNVLSAVSQGGSYVIESLNPASYLLRAYVDKNRNNRHDPDSEPFYETQLRLSRSQNLDIHLAYADTTKPTIKQVQAVNDREILIHFSEALAGYESVKLLRLDTGGELPILIASLDSNKLTLLTQEQEPTNYRVEIRGIRDPKGNLSAFEKMDFRASEQKDLQPPKLVSSTPRNGSSVNSLQPSLELRFSEIIPASAFSASLRAAETNVDIDFSIEGANSSFYTLKPKQPLQNYRSYNLTVSCADISGNKDEFKLSFMPLLRGN